MLLTMRKQIYILSLLLLGILSTSSFAADTDQAVAAPAVQEAAQPSNDEINQRIQTAQTSIMNDPEMMKQVQAMAQDPELMKLLSDPTLVKAVMAHDVKAIEGNPKAQELMNNPKMRALAEQMRGSTSSK